MDNVPPTPPQSERRSADVIVALEQYITHVKITEDSAHPSTPPPNLADTSNRKQRFIVVSGLPQTHPKCDFLILMYSSATKWDRENAQDP